MQDLLFSMWRWCGLWWLGLVAFLAAAPSRAEHRVALLIANSNYEAPQLDVESQSLSTLVAALGEYSVRCKVRENLQGTDLKAALESFAETTPTDSTAIVFFRGQALAGNYKGKDGVFLVGTDAKPGDLRSVGNTGSSINGMLELLSSRGGSSTNLVIVDAVDGPSDYKQEPPNDCLLAFATSELLSKKLTGNGDMISEIQAAAARSDANFAHDLQISGRGSRVVSSGDKLVEGNKAGDEWVNSRGMVFCWCPPGSYTAGSPKDESGRYPDEQQREVVIKHGFWISKFEMTLRENLRNHPRSTIAKHKNDPLTMINHDDAKRMTIVTLSESERKAGNLPSDWQYSLPTEEQWEYAARAGTTSRFYFGDSLEDLTHHANFGDKSYYDSKDIFANSAHRILDDGVVRLARAGSYRANPWGLHDVYGNVAEWCINGAIRGGSWASVAENCRSAYRDHFSSRNEQNFIGYRLVVQRIPAPVSNRAK